jgi:hypothetical protein
MSLIVSIALMGLHLEEITKNLTAEYPDHKDQLLVDLEAFFLKLIELKVLIEQK